ncbi:hypothetical protein LINPERPRIM_LOCUS24859 [Linum perenne]
MAATNFNGGLDAADPNLVEADAGNDDVIAQVVPSIDNADGQNAVITGSGVAQADPTAIVDEVRIEDATATDDIHFEEATGEVPMGEEHTEDTGEFAHEADDDANFQDAFFHEDVPAVQLTEDDLKDARERAELSFYVKWLVRMDLLDSFLGTTPVFRPNGTSFPVYFQYIGVPCICYLCGFLGHVMSDCSHTDVVFDVNVPSLWMCGKVAPNEKEGKGPQLQPLPPVQPRDPNGRGGLLPSVTVGLSSTLNSQWARECHAGGISGRGGPTFRGPRPLLALAGPASHRGPGLRNQPSGSGSTGPRYQDVRPLQIMAPGNCGPAGVQAAVGSNQERLAHVPAQLALAASLLSGIGRPGQALGRSAHQNSLNVPASVNGHQ